jgi:signal transduction histidine kinase/ActR/RegA family two-component response regulator
MADQLAIAIENARLYQQARQEISERQRAEAELAKERAMLAERVAERTMDLMAANEELARAARLKDEFLASMSHELRTPLTAVLGMVEILKMEAYGPLTEQQNKSLDVIDDSGRHLLELINDILDLSKIEADKLELEIEPVSVDSVCQSSLQFVKQTALDKYIDVSFEHDTDVSVLQADERRLKQILVNLLSNAVKFTPDEGQVGLEVVADHKNQRAHFVVWDTGIGIAPEDRDRLFQPFVQLDSKLARQYSGTGLGLALVNRMTKMHGGEVAVESEVGKGSRFTVSLPWPGNTSVPPDGQTATPDAGEEKLVAEALPQKRTDPDRSALVLLAEDEYTTTLLVTDFLQMSGYQVITAETGTQAIEQAKAEKPDVILMDIQMPEMDGLEAIQHLRADGELAHVPIIAFTALAMEGDKERCLAAGASDYLSKPIDLSRLALCIDRYLDQREA